MLGARRGHTITRTRGQMDANVVPQRVAGGTRALNIQSQPLDVARVMLLMPAQFLAFLRNFRMLPALRASDGIAPNNR